MAADFYVGEHGDTLQITMPFDASVDGQVVTAELMKPDRSTLIAWSSGFTVAPTSVTRTIATGELDQAGRYLGTVTVTRTSPTARVRKVGFELVVDAPA